MSSSPQRLVLFCRRLGFTASKKHNKQARFLLYCCTTWYECMMGNVNNYRAYRTVFTVRVRMYARSMWKSSTGKVLKQQQEAWIPYEHGSELEPLSKREDALEGGLRVYLAYYTYDGKRCYIRMAFFSCFHPANDAMYGIFPSLTMLASCQEGGHSKLRIIRTYVRTRYSIYKRENTHLREMFAYNFRTYHSKARRYTI